jgi:hypothetical protein
VSFYSLYIYTTLPFFSSPFVGFDLFTLNITLFSHPSHSIFIIVEPVLILWYFTVFVDCLFSI